ncbi:hypothetical protein Bca52824_022827 [Brassica carinata]|uniref:Germin-like protein n=1 Tax=Brassica carinata TaxID=52824 RepID=A0A8X7VH41_BRACI|nr:hypothetical protein Bca52824_022827 [Brassica carinata]
MKVSRLCVADPSGPPGPLGFSCKNPEQVTAKDFSFSATVTTGFAPAFPGANGVGVSVVRLDLAYGEGTIRARIICSANEVYLKTLQKGEVMVFPQGLLHFALKNGTGPALAFAAFRSSNPGLQLVSNALFASDLPSELIEATTFLSHEEVKRLKAIIPKHSLDLLAVLFEP